MGQYEGVVVGKIVKSGPFNDAVCIGTADGYYAAGLLKSGLAKRVICFEITESGREAVQKNAGANGVADRVAVLGKADEKLGEHLRTAGFSAEKALVMCDIEGAEFDVLTSEVLAAQSGALLIVELQDVLMPGGTALREALIARLPAGSSPSILKERPADWSGIPELEALGSSDRALIASEGRKMIGEWLIVEPKAANA